MKGYTLFRLKLCLLAMFLSFVVSLDALAAGQKKFSKKYRDVRLESVLQDLSKSTGYRIDVDTADIDMDKRVTADFKEVGATTVLKKVLDKDLQYKIKKGVIYITKKPTPPVVYTVIAQQPSEILENDSSTISVYQDTVLSVTCRTVTREVSKEEAEQLGNVRSEIQKTQQPKIDKKKQAAQRKKEAAKRKKNAKKKKQTAKKKNKSNAVANNTKKTSTASSTSKTGNVEKEVELMPNGYVQGHWIQAMLGGSYSSLGYSLKNSDGANVGSEVGNFGGLVQLQYAYFWNDHWGVTAGVGFSTYSSLGTLNTTKIFEGQTDSDGELYDHYAVTHDWKERQAMYMVDIPIAIQLQYPISGNIRLYADAGIKLGFPVMADYRLKSGELEHIGQYDKWGLTLDKITGHDFYTENVSDFGTGKHSLSYTLPAIGVLADVGVAIPVAQNVDILVGTYCNYTCNSVRSDEVKIGWRQPKQEGFKQHSFMNEYVGEIASEYVNAVHPWQVGIKIGVAWHAPKRKPKVEPVIKYYARFLECDTTITLQPRQEVVMKQRKVVEEITKMMETSVIWFNLDSSEPKLQPADILDKIADVLIKNPNQKIIINGHASKEGSQRHNQKLSEARARAIEKLLSKKGVRAEQMQVNALSSSQAYQQGEHAISLDRRVEIIPVEEHK